MPVNEKNGNEELLEQGWRQMQGLLDLEMPQNRNKKWGLWIPLSVLGAAFIIIALLIFPTDKSNEAVPVNATNPHESFAQSDKNGASTQSITTKENNGEILNDGSESSVVDNIHEGSQGQAALNSDIARSDEQAHPADSESKTSGGNNALRSNKHSEADNSNVGEPNESMATVANMTELESEDKTAASGGSETFEVVDNSDDNEEISSEVATGANNELSGEVKGEGVESAHNIGHDLALVSDIEAVPNTGADDLLPPSHNDGIGNSTQRRNVVQESLAPVSMSSLTSETKPIELMAMPITPAAALIKPKVGLEVYGAPHFVSNVELQGIEAGALATVTLGRRWKIFGGASYGHYNNSGILPTVGRSQSSDAENFDVPVIADTTMPGYPIVDPQIAYSKIGYDTAQLLTEKFNYLHFPVFAQFRLGRFFSLTGGFKISYLLNAPSNKNLSAIAPNSSLGGSLDLNASSNFLDDENILRKWDVAPMLGVAFDVGRKLSFDIQYQHGLIPYVDRPTENERSDYHRSVSLGLRYRIL